MFARRDLRVKSLMGVALGLVALAAGVWAAPAFGGASEAAEDQTLSVFVNIPLNEIQDGQFCQGYANVSGGTPPYDFEWSGQFTNADASPGPQGNDQIVSGFVDEDRGDLTVVVTDSDENDAHDTAHLNIDPNHPYNEGCEA